jgi:hypothetical protein
MIYDSIRQGKPAIRNNFGAGRLNTRLSFYFFEINRLSFIQKKSFYNNRFYNKKFGNKTQESMLLTIDNLDSTLFSYKFYHLK